MKNQKSVTQVFVGLITAVMLLSVSFAFAAQPDPLSPEMAAKREMVRKQEEQRITPEKKKAAVEALKAERLKVYKAKQEADAAKGVAPITPENK
jgi:hypothetical protein